MSNQHSSIYRYLVGVGNNAALLNGTFPTNTGQFAILSPTGGAAPSTAGSDFIVAVKTATGSIRTDVINRAKLRYASAVCNVPAVSPVIDILNMCATCNSEAFIKVRFRSANVWQLNGTDFVKTYALRNDCCTGQAADCVAMVKSFRDQINADPKKLFTAVAIGVVEGVTTVLDNVALSTWDASEGNCPGIRLTANGIAVADFCGIPYIYDYPTGVSIDATVQGFNCCSPATTVTTTTQPVYAEGAGADIKYLEWSNAANAQNGTTPVITESGVVFNRDLNAAAGTSYAQITLAVNDVTNGTFLTYQDPKTYVFALPINQNTAADPFVKRLDVLLGLSPTLQSRLTGCFTFTP
jgi:hypothetical protein